ncbi:unnamed protein product [Schistocephalus solidus]|uniref:Uncharacterized protein n=1 Tax=Schistocephalus solidus TaxID=70667 RepID=A0A183TG10_SCHSO|nr:unnamed protein product [Schistocephalus solidus]
MNSLTISRCPLKARQLVEQEEENVYMRCNLFHRFHVESLRHPPTSPPPLLSFLHSSPLSRTLWDSALSRRLSSSSFSLSL